VARRREARGCRERTNLYCPKRLEDAALVRALQAEAAASRKPLRIHVERFNPALRLYERLGFKQIADRGVYLWNGGRRRSPRRNWAFGIRNLEFATNSEFQILNSQFHPT
jgi:ribosomal protein S18 acetylase RimI-like enzyme